MKPLFRAYEGYAPSAGGICAITLLFLAGVALGSVVVAPLAKFFPPSRALEYTQLISYPLMFVPAMVYAGFRKAGKRTALDTQSPGGVYAPVAVVLTLVAAFMTDALTSVLPDMPENLKTAMDAITGGTLWVNLVCVSVFAPFFEEWLCRGIVQRGLLAAGKSPVVAIGVSALFFALIHMNPWQAIPAFVLGCLFGYVYYKTGSLKLTMLMHCANNTFSVFCTRMDCFEDAQTWLDVMPAKWYWLSFAACALLLVLCIRVFKKSETPCW